MKAVSNNIIIISEKLKKDKTKGGLLIIEKDREDIRYRKAKVVSVSDDITTIKKDDNIFYDRHAGHGIEFEKEKIIVIKLQDVVVVL